MLYNKILDLKNRSFMAPWIDFTDRYLILFFLVLRQRYKHGLARHMLIT